MKTLSKCVIILLLCAGNIVSLGQHSTEGLIINGQPQQQNTAPADFSRSDCDIIDSLPSPSLIPLGIAWDGQHLWHSGEGVTSDVYQMDTLGNLTGTINYLPVSLAGLDFANGYLWGVNEQSAKLYKINTINSTYESYALPTLYPSDPNLWGITIGGGYLWACEYGIPGNSISAIFKLDPATVTPVDTIVINANIMGIKWKDGLIFAIDHPYQKLSVIDPADGNILQTFNWCVKKPFDLTFQNDNLWNVSAPMIFGGNQCIYKVHTDILLISSTEPGNQKNDQFIKISPNPATDEITVTLPQNFEANGVNLEIYNTDGVVLKKQAIIGLTAKVSLTDLNQGLYFILIKSKNETLIPPRKLIIL